jgi:hypothetical protein
MFRDEHLGRKFYKYLRTKNEENRLTHEPSGKLTASILGDPIQWQILKVMGVPAIEVDDYLLGKFERGDDVELKCLEFLTGLKDKQKKVEYRNVVGVADAIVDSDIIDKDDKWDFQLGIIPHEIKSVSNAKFKRIMDAKEADEGHILQGCLYALALDMKYFGIDYCSTDDYRFSTWVYKTADYKKQVDDVIDKFDETIKNKTIPIFEPRYAWQENEKYNKYPDFMKLSQEEIEVKLQVEFSQQYKKLMGS